jgi:glutamate carboxypeptidase
MENIGAIRGGGALNIVPDYAIAGLNARIATAEAGRLFEERLAELAADVNARDGYRLEIAGQFNRGPLELTPARETLFAAYHETAGALSLDFGWQDVGGGSDGNLLGAAGLPCLDGIGAHGDGMHSDREWVRISSLAERARLAAVFLARLAAGELALPLEIASRALVRA